MKDTAIWSNCIIIINHKIQLRVVPLCEFSAIQCSTFPRESLIQGSTGSTICIQGSSKWYNLWPLSGLPERPPPPSLESLMRKFCHTNFCLLSPSSWEAREQPAQDSQLHACPTGSATQSELVLAGWWFVAKPHIVQTYSDTSEAVGLYEHGSLAVPVLLSVTPRSPKTYKMCNENTSDQKFDDQIV